MTRNVSTPASVRTVYTYSLVLMVQVSSLRKLSWNSAKQSRTEMHLTPSDATRYLCSLFDDV